MQETHTEEKQPLKLGMTTRSKKRELSEQFQSLSTADTKNCDSRDESSGAESEAECPGCGLVYREDGSSVMAVDCGGIQNVRRLMMTKIFCYFYLCKLQLGTA